MKISIFENASSIIKTHKDQEILTIINAIKTGKWKAKIDYLRAVLIEKGKEEYDKDKKKLLGVTWSGTFSERKDNALEEYSGIMCLDIDNLEESQLISLKEDLSIDEYVYLVFTSPSNKGLKILVKVDSSAEYHLGAFLHLQKIFEEKYLFKVDDSGKNISRLCFVSSDPALYYNQDSKVFNVDIRYGEVKKYTPPENLKNYKPVAENSTTFEICIKWIEKNIKYVSGQRNRYIHALACAMNRCGVDLSETEHYIKSRYDLPEKEIAHCCKSAYLHNSSEFATVEVKDIGSQEFVAPPYIANYTEDVVENDIMQITSMLYYHKIEEEEIIRIVKLVAKYYHSKEMIDFKRKSLGTMMSEAVNALNGKVAEATSKNKLEYVKAQDLGRKLVKVNVGERCIPTNIPSLDISMRGGMMPGSVYAIIGVGGTYKSILAQFFSVAAANTDKACLYLCGEMSEYQYYERLCSMILHINLWQALSSKQVSEENIETVVNEINVALKDNMFFVGGTGFSKTNTLATVKNIESTTGKKIGMVVIDGLSQMDSNGLQEIPAAIANSEVCKIIAKEGELVVIPLIHISGDQSSAKIRRDNGPFVRGGGKVLANLDGYFSTSLLINEEDTKSLSGSGELIYIEDKFYLRYVDKRAGTGIANTIINVGKNIELREDENDPRSFEVQL